MTTTSTIDFTEHHTKYIKYAAAFKRCGKENESEDTDNIILGIS